MGFVRPLTIVFFLGLCGCTQDALACTSDARDAFFNSIASMCCVRFSGQSSFPEDPGDDFH